MNNVDRVVDAIRSNPEGLLLLGAGVALMLRTSIGGSASSLSAPQPRSTQQAGDEQAKSRQSGAMHAVSDGIATARSLAADAADGLGERAAQFTEAATQEASRISGSARESVNHIVDSQPIAVAIAGVAVGCIAAAFLPTSRLENETLRPLGRQAVDALSNAGERVKGAAVAAGEQLKDAAADRGLHKEGLVEVARDVAKTFKDSVTEEQKPRAADFGSKPSNSEAKSSASEGMTYGR